MARIEEKSKEKLSSVICAWIIAGILAAVVITSIVLVIIYFVELNKKDEEKVFEERFPSATAPNGRINYAQSSTLTQFPGRDLSSGTQDPVRNEVIR